MILGDLLASKIADSNRKDSWAVRFRLKRMLLFKSLIAAWPRPINILDIGGMEFYWETMGLAGDPDYQIVMVNLTQFKTRHANISSIQGDARFFSEIVSQQGKFNLVFSNSVIEHVGGFGDQAKMVAQIRSLGVPYFVQTPNRNFPLEAHCLIPFFQFLPDKFKSFLIQKFKIRGYRHVKDPLLADLEAKSIQLLDLNDCRSLFPGAKIYKEKFLCFTKSFVMYGNF